MLQAMIHSWLWAQPTRWTPPARLVVQEGNKIMYEGVDNFTSPGACTDCVCTAH